MKTPQIRLAVAAALFVAWIGYLAYVALAVPRPEILSRPQFLISSLDVVAEVRSPEQPVIIRKVEWPRDAQQPREGDQITVTNLADCQGWSGPGDYILPLQELHPGHAMVSPLPRSPGFLASAPRIYRATPETLAELEHLPRSVSPE
jgi:hypothetical protein